MVEGRPAMLGKVISVCVLSLPLVCFVSATFLELKRDRCNLRSVTRILPLSVAGAASIFLLIPLTVYLGILGSTTVSSGGLSTTMSIVALLVASCGFLCRYKSRLAAVLIVFGGIVLALFWRLNRVIV